MLSRTAVPVVAYVHLSQLCRRGGGKVVHEALRLVPRVSGRLMSKWCCCGGGVVRRLCACIWVLVAPSRPEGRRVIDSSGRGNPRRVRLAHGVWHDQPLGTTSAPPCHGVNNKADTPWLGAGRGEREGCARGWRRYWSCTARHSLARASAIDTYSEQAALLMTILAGRIVTTTIAHCVTCDTISFSVEEATGRTYVRALPVAQRFSAYSKGPVCSEARALCSCNTGSVVFARIGRFRRTLPRAPGYASCGGRERHFY